MSFGLARGRELDAGAIGVDVARFPPLPDDVALNPQRARLDVGALFENPDLPLEIEIGSGKGTFLVDYAPLHPGVNLLGFEWAREFCLYAADRCRRRGLANVRLINADATEFLHWRVPSAHREAGEDPGLRPRGGVRVIHLYFSDPWPKTRHHRRRVVQDRFLTDCARILAPGGELRIVTDHADYWAWMEEHFARFAQGENAPFERRDFAPPQSAAPDELVGTNFERKYRREGRPFNAAVLVRKGAPAGA